jgi:penicillin-binding protein 1A
MARRALIHEIESRERRRRWFPALAGLLTVSVLVSTWIGLFSFMGANAAFGTFSDLEDEYIPDVRSMDLSFPDLSRVSRVYASGGELLAELHDGRISEPTPISEVPQVVIHAFLAAEDEDFYEHEGVDFTAIAKAALENILYDTTRGGSTITQQVVKNSFVGNEVTIRRKIAEAFVSAEIERRLTKDQILEFYLNSVFFGSNAYGVTAAAKEYFDKELDDLEIHEAATLAVIVRNPSLYNPRKRPETVRDRRDRVIAEMLANDWITDVQARNARRQRLEVRERTQVVGEADHVVAEVKRELLNDPEFAFLGATKEERKLAIFGCPADDTECEGGGGLRIELTIDLFMQNAANDILAAWFPVPPYEENLEQCSRIFPDESAEFLAAYAETHSCAPTGAIATVDNATGAVIVMASGLPFDVSQFDLAVQGRRNPGSSFKPFTLVAALENEISMKSTWNGGSPQRIACPYVCSDEGNVWEVRNAGASYGNIDLQRATTSSVNTVFAALAVEVGPDKIVEAAHRMGVESPLTAVPSITLGASAVTPLEMASAYSNFATNGLHADPYLISKIYDSAGNLLYEHGTRVEQVGDPAVFAAIRRPLIKVPTSEGTAERADIGRNQAGKTGTHQNYYDAWYVGFVPQYSTAVWVGYEAKQVSLRNVTINGSRYDRVFGGSVPAPIWAEFNRILLANVPDAEFPADPENIEDYFEIPTTTAPSVVGLDVQSALAAIRKARLYPWEVPVPSLEPAGTVTGQSLAPGAVVQQGTVMYINVATGQVPQAALPNVVGLPYDQAAATLAQLQWDAGVRLQLSRVNVSGTGAPGGTVVSMDPGPGASVGYGALVTLYVAA